MSNEFDDPDDSLQRGVQPEEPLGDIGAEPAAEPAAPETAPTTAPAAPEAVFCRRCMAFVVPDSGRRCPTCQAFLSGNQGRLKHPIDVARQQALLDDILRSFPPADPVEAAERKSLSIALERLERATPGSIEWSRLHSVAQELGGTIRAQQAQHERDAATRLATINQMTSRQVLERLDSMRVRFAALIDKEPGNAIEDQRPRSTETRTSSSSLPSLADLERAFQTGSADSADDPMNLSRQDGPGEAIGERAVSGHPPNSEPRQAADAEPRCEFCHLPLEECQAVEASQFDRAWPAEQHARMAATLERWREAHHYDPREVARRDAHATA